MQAMLAFHIAISLIGIASGFIVMGGMIRSQPMLGIARIFLLTTTLTSVTGFFLPATHFMPSHAVGIISLAVLAIAIYAFYGGLTGARRWMYVIAAIAAQYFNVFVGIVQSFEKISFLHSLAPTQKEPPFAVTQLVVLLAFVVFGIVAARKFRPK